MVNKSLIIFLASLCFLILQDDALAKSKNRTQKSNAKLQKLSAKEKKAITVKSGDIESKSDLKANVKLYKGTYCIKNIPMIDQGNQPACVPCSFKRLLDYYAGGNSGVGLNSIEKALGYNKENGTNVAFMMKAVERYSRQMKMQCEQIYYAYDSDDICEKYLAEYNRLCKKDKLTDTSPAVFRNQEAYEAMFKNMDYKTWRQAKKVDGRAKDVQKAILKSIKGGYPVMWSVTLGLYKESTGKANTVGGHMRLIIGFDPDSKDVYYSDSWGNNHSRKKMPWNDAWTITSSMILVRP